MIFVDKIMEFDDFIGGHGRSNEEIENAQKQLGVVFADEYKEYLSRFGLACFNGHEITGICSMPRLDVVAVTIKNREFNPNIPEDLYVIEELGIDGIVFLQSFNGQIYLSRPNSKVFRVCNSLSELFEPSES